MKLWEIDFFKEYKLVRIRKNYKLHSKEIVYIIKGVMYNSDHSPTLVTDNLMQDEFESIDLQ